MDWTTLQILIASAFAGALIAALALWKPLAARRRRREIRSAIESFRMQREYLEAKFTDLARLLGKPRGLRWRECEWHDEVTFARDRATRLLTAFVGVSIRFEAVEGGDMEDVAAVGTVREAVGVFHYRRGRWGTGGRALFNMNPTDAVSRLEGQFEPVSVSPRAASPTGAA